MNAFLQREIRSSMFSVLTQINCFFLDEDPVAFQQQFVPVFERRYKIVTLGNFKHLLFDMHPMYEPMVEMLICSSARVFVGTMYVQNKEKRKGKRNEGKKGKRK